MGRFENTYRCRAGKILLACALLMPALASAEPCDLSRDEDGRWHGNCSLSELFKNRFELDIEISRAEPRYRLKLPNLHPRKFKYQLIGTSVDAFIDVQNLGEVDSRAADVAVMFRVTDPRNGHVEVQSWNTVQTAPAIQAGTERRIYLATFSVPDNQQDWDVTTIAVVDPPSPSSPAVGAVWESNELDNALMTTCRIYGENPDPSVSPCN